jgi:hypothetical protein
VGYVCYNDLCAVCACYICYVGCVGNKKQPGENVMIYMKIPKLDKSECKDSTSFLLSVSRIPRPERKRRGSAQWMKRRARRGRTANDDLAIALASAAPVALAVGVEVELVVAVVGRAILEVWFEGIAPGVVVPEGNVVPVAVTEGVPVPVPVPVGVAGVRAGGGRAAAGLLRAPIPQGMG